MYQILKFLHPKLAVIIAQGIIIIITNYLSFLLLSKITKYEILIKSGQK